MKKFLKSFNNWPLGFKILFAFLFGAILPILLSQEISYRLNSHYMTKKIDELALTNLTQIAERTNLTIDTYTNILYQIYIDDDIARQINNLQSDSVYGIAIAYNKIYNRLKQFNIEEKGIRCLSVVCADGKSVTYDFETGSALDNLWNGTKDMRETAPYLNAVDEIGMVLTPTQEMKEKGESKYLFHISKRIFDLNHLEKGTTATAILTVNAEIFRDICKMKTKALKEPVEAAGKGFENEIIFILNDKREVIYYPEEMFMGITLDQEISLKRFIEISGLLKNKEIIINEYRDSTTGWKFYYAYDKIYMLKDMKSVQKNMYFTAFLILMVSLLLILYTVRHIHQSINTVVQGMNQVKEGNLNVVVPVKSGDEIGQMAENFNEMTQEVRRLITEVTEATQKQKNAEIKALEAQINPHFLYNTLDSINWMAIEKGEYEISTMLRNLGVILRYSINKSNQLATVREMKDWMEKYISLQKMRFNDAFDYKINVEEQTLPLRLHKLLLQPFLENAIVHGFEGMEQGGLLSVDIFMTEQKEAVCIIIEDNGNGMSKEQTACYNDRFTLLKKEGESIGLTNAFSRMYMYYGEAAVWNINSEEGMGTVITLKIPAEKREEEEDANRDCGG